MAKSITEPLLKDHAKIRSLAGELKAFTERFDLPGMRASSQSLIDVIDPHVLKEESGLYLIGMKFLKADNSVLPDLFKEHHQLASRLSRLTSLFYSARLTNVEDQARQLVFVILDGIDEHFQEEESKVFPALEALVTDDAVRDLILQRYQIIDAGTTDDLDRMPLLSLPDERVGAGGLSFT